MCFTPVAMPFFNKKGMIMGPLEHFMLPNHVLPVDVSWRKCLIPMKSALSESEALFPILFSQSRAFRNSDKLSISKLRLTKGIIFKLIEKQLFSSFCSLYPSVFLGSLKSFLGVTKCPPSLLSLFLF
jgi:hypothetical protein